MYKCLYVFLICFLYFSLSACVNQNEKDIKKIVDEWSSKEIVFPDNPIFTKFAKDTIVRHFKRNSNYKILTYIDSIGCLRCHLNLSMWKPFIRLLKDTFPECNVLFFIHPRNKRSAEYLLKKENFDYPVCIDEKDSLNKMNHFPTELQFQTFLLDKDNKVVAIGNPILNPNIKNLYFNILLGRNDGVEESQVPITQITMSESLINMGSFSWKEKQEKEVKVRNVGNFPLGIDEILTSCGCIVIEYDKKPILPKDSTSIKIKYQAEHPEHFDKTITVYCNAKGAPFQLKISGDAK